MSMSTKRVQAFLKFSGVDPRPIPKTLLPFVLITIAKGVKSLSEETMTYRSMSAPVTSFSVTSIVREMSEAFFFGQVEKHCLAAIPYLGISCAHWRLR